MATGLQSCDLKWTWKSVDYKFWSKEKQQNRHESMSSQSILLNNKICTVSKVNTNRTEKIAEWKVDGFDDLLIDILRNRQTPKGKRTLTNDSVN